MIVSKKKSLLKNSKFIDSKPNRKYVARTTVVCSQGLPNAAYFCIIILDENKKEIERKIKWINDFNGLPCSYSLVFETPPMTAFVVLGFRINCENQLNKNIEDTKGDFEIDLPDLSSLTLDEVNDKEEVDSDYLVAASIPALTTDEEKRLEEKMVWILGSPRSGSTWLADGLLNNEQNIFWDEPYIGWILGYLSRLHKDRIQYFFSDYNKDSLSSLLRKIILARTLSHTRTLTKNVIIKEPNGSIGADFIMSCLPNSKIIFLLRDGRDVVDSLLDAHEPDSWNSKATKLPSSSWKEDRSYWIKEYSSLWKLCSETVLKSFQRHDPNLRLLIRYEDLRKNTVNELKKIYDFLGLDNTTEMLKNIVEKNSFENIDPNLKGPKKFNRFAKPGKWKENLTSEDEKIMEQVMGNTLRKLGYTSDQNEDIFGFIDYPIKNEECGGELGVEGWALSNLENDLIIEILVDNVLMTNTVQNKLRPDIARIYPIHSSANKSGFEATVCLNNFDNGQHQLEVVAKSSSYKKSLGNKNFILNKNKLLPPKQLQDYVGGIFIDAGLEFFRYLIEWCALKPNEKVLDVGCGAGRLAVPLTRFLEGNYEGFDINFEAIKWCQQNITSRYPNFHFTRIDLKNDYYNPQGKYSASEFKFPYHDNYFDLIFLTSVFTHLHPMEVENYLSEISRVLKRNGKCLITLFLLNEESTNMIRLGKSDQNFIYEFDGFTSTNKKIPGSSIAYKEKDILKILQKYEIDITKPIKYGWWCGREKNFSYQDIIIGRKL